jgi:hypothetical protein
MRVRDTLVKLRLLRLAQQARSIFPVGGAAYREQRRALANFKAEFGPGFQVIATPKTSRGTALLFGLDTISGVALHSVIISGFRQAGYEPTVVLEAQSYVLEEAYRSLGVKSFVFLERFSAPEAASGARRLIDGIAHSADFLALMEGNCRVGRAALSTFMRRRRRGEIDLSDPALRQPLEAELADSVAAAHISSAVMEQQRPSVVVFVDRGYTPTAQFFDQALAAGIPIYTWNAGHRDNILMLKRYSRTNCDSHPFSLSPDSWQRMKRIAWGPEQWGRVHAELESCYRSGQWFSEVGTQTNKQFLAPNEIRERLDLTPDRKVAGVFPHIFWDATFFWGTDLFESYERWFVETMRCAAASPDMDWLVKIHPANLVKDQRDGYRGEHSELAALRRISAELPRNVRLIPADSDISTLSLLSLIDYCLTVRGTVGMEAACFGIPVVTAGTGRYDRLGFTLDPATASEFRSLLSRLHEVPRMPPDQVELARRFAFGALLARPLPLDTIRMSYAADTRATLSVSYQGRRNPAFEPGGDVLSLAAWIVDGSEDYLADNSAYFSAPTG